MALFFCARPSLPHDLGLGSQHLIAGDRHHLAYVPGGRAEREG